MQCHVMSIALNSTGRSGLIGRVEASHVGSSGDRVKLMLYQIDICCYLAQRSALLEYGWLAQYQDNVTGSEIGYGAAGLVAQ